MKRFKDNTHAIVTADDVLNLWDLAVPSAILEKQKQLASRRQFLGQSIAFVGSLAISTASLASTAIKKKSLAEPWLTISDVQNHLFPRQSDLNNILVTPGAADFNAIRYLQAMLNTVDADKDQKEFIIKGASWLNGIANNMKGHSFIKLNKENKQVVLKKISTSDTGETWLSTLLTYIFEALLTDPVYGGNSDKLGWEWLEHQAGFPLPPNDKRYWLLGYAKNNNKKTLKGAS